MGDALTYKTYLVFAKNLVEVYPSRKQAIPIKVKNILDNIGDLHYADKYSSRTGTVHNEKVLVNDSTMYIPQKFKSDEDINFYIEQNPLYKQGYGLLTITPMHRSNILNLIKKQIRKWMEKKSNRMNKNLMKHEKDLFFRLFKVKFF